MAAMHLTLTGKMSYISCMYIQFTVYIQFTDKQVCTGWGIHAQRVLGSGVSTLKA